MGILARSNDPCSDANRLLTAHPEMSILGHLRDSACSGSLNRLKSFYTKSKVELAKTCANLLSDMNIEKIATLSRSSAVINCLKRSSVSKVIISESRPGLEGIETAKILREEGFSITLVIDALLPWYAKRSGAIGLVGADRVTPKYLVNKAGTYPLALSVSTITVPGLLKLYSETYVIKEREPGEVAELEGVNLVNMYFDETPLDVLKSIVFEGFSITPKEIDKAFKRLDKLLD